MNDPYPPPSDRAPDEETSYPQAYPQAYPPAPAYQQPYQQAYHPYQAGYQQPAGMAPAGFGYGVDPVTGQPLSDKSKLAAGLLNLLLPLVGILGIGRLYQGQITIGLVQLLGGLISAALICVFVGVFLYPVFWIWSVVDGIVILAGRPTDPNGRLLR